MEKLKDEVWRRATGDNIGERERGGRGLFCGRGGWGEKGGTLKAGDTEKTTVTYYIESTPRPFKSPFAPFLSSFLFFFFFFSPSIYP